MEDQQGRHILVASWVHGIHVPSFLGDPGFILGADSLHGTLHPERILDVWPWKRQGDHILAASWPRGSGEKTKKKVVRKKREIAWMQAGVVDAAGPKPRICGCTSNRQDAEWPASKPCIPCLRLSHALGMVHG